METKKLVEVTDDFDAVRPGEVYPTTIKIGEIVDGRLAEVALELECGVERDGETVKDSAGQKRAAPPQNKPAAPDQNKAAEPDQSK